MLGVGGNREVDIAYELMVGTESGRATFVESVIRYVEDYAYDGVLLHFMLNVDQYHTHLLALLEQFREAKFMQRFSLAIALPYDFSIQVYNSDTLSRIAE